MESLDKISCYVNTICNQMHFKKAKELVYEEMKNHVIDQRDYYIEQGWKEEEATIQAISDTGDPITIGEQFDKVHKPKPQWSLFIAIGVLLLSGILIRMLFLQDAKEQWLFADEIASIFIGIMIMITFYFIDFTLIVKHSKIIYSFIMLFVVICLMYGTHINGRITFLLLGKIQISLFCFGLIFPISYVSILYKMRNRGYSGLLLCGLAFSIPAFLILSIPSAALFALFAICSFILTGTAIYKGWFGVKRSYSYMLMILPAMILSIFYISRLRGYQLARIYSLLNIKEENYTGMLTKELILGAKFIGQGEIPAGYMENTFPLPNINTDFLLTYLIHNYGWISFIFILLVLLIIIIKGFSLCYKQKSDAGLFISLAVLLTFSMEIAGYVACNLGFLNVAPISLPLISSGSTGLIINMGLIGLMLSVFRTGDVVFEGKLNVVPQKMINFTDGTLTIKFK